MAITADNPVNQSLIDIARRSIEHELQCRTRWLPNPEDYPPAWRQKRATFVTLSCRDQLRGCIGTTEPVDCLVTSIASNAHAAAFGDPRFPPLTVAEYAGIEIGLSLLTPAEPLNFSDETELLEQLVPGHHGLIIEYGGRRATFLPMVWEHLPRPDQFLATLKQKGNLPHDQPPQRAWCYCTETVVE